MIKSIEDSIVMINIIIIMRSFFKLSIEMEHNNILA